MHWRQVLRQGGDVVKRGCVGGKFGALGERLVRTWRERTRTNENKRCECVGGKFGALGERLDI